MSNKEQDIINQIKKMIKDEDVENLSYYKDIKNNLQDKVELLEYIARQKWREIYDSYEPISYERTGATLSSQAIRVGKFERVGEYLTVNVTYDDNIAYKESSRLGVSRQSEFNDNRLNLEANNSHWDTGNNVGHAWVKISEGWIDAPTSRGKNGKIRDFEEGTHYLGEVVEEFENYNKSQNLGITLDVKWKGQKVLPKMG